MSPNDLYKSYKECADFIPGCAKTNVNTLMNLYIQHKEDMQGESYLSAIVLHYWPKINRMYIKSQPYATFEDAYDWMLDAILETSRYAPWLDETNKLYTDPNAPDKVINRMVGGIRANWFQAQNRFSRKINMNVLSTDAFLEKEGFEPDSWTAIVQTNSDGDNPIYGLVRQLFKSLNYEKAFVLDMIVFDKCETEKDLVETFKERLDDVYLSQFAERYDMKFDQVDEAAEYIRAKNTKQLKENVNERLKEIRTQFDIKELLHV